MFSYQDQLYKVPLSMCILELPDATSLVAGDPRVPTIPCLPEVPAAARLQPATPQFLQLPISQRPPPPHSLPCPQLPSSFP